MDEDENHIHEEDEVEGDVVRLREGPFRLSTDLVDCELESDDLR